MKKKEKTFRKTYRRKIKKPFYKKKIFVYLISFLFFSAFIFYFLFFWDFFQIKKIEISGNQRTETKDLINFIEKETIKPFLFLESRNVFLFFPRKIAPEIIEEFPGLSEFQLSKQYPDKVKLKVKERKSIGVWCRENDCFSFDSTGKIFEKTRTKKGLIVEIENKDFLIGEKILSLKNMESLIKIWNYLIPEISPEKFSVEKSKLVVSIKDNWEIYFNLEEEIDFQLIKLELTLKEKISDENRKRIEYIDLRFDKRVYFKYR